MAYYPPSQIKTNLYTGGAEFVVEKSKQEYIGYYYALSDGTFYSGKNPNNKPNNLLKEKFEKRDGVLHEILFKPPLPLPLPFPLAPLPTFLLSLSIGVINAFNLLMPILIIPIKSPIKLSNTSSNFLNCPPFFAKTFNIINTKTSKVTMEFATPKYANSFDKIEFTYEE